MDRLTTGYVVDFLHVHFWPIFNVADSAVSVGVVILAIYLLLRISQRWRRGSFHPQQRATALWLMPWQTRRWVVAEGGERLDQHLGGVGRGALPHPGA